MKAFDTYLFVLPVRAARRRRRARLRHREDILDGLDQAPDAIAGLYRGENQGKRLIWVGPG